LKLRLQAPAREKETILDNPQQQPTPKEKEPQRQPQTDKQSAPPAQIPEPMPGYEEHPNEGHPV
jgi:hypothetical protein